VSAAIGDGVDINAADERGYTALIWACMHGFAETVALLLSTGAEVEAKDRFGQTALYFACINKHSSVANLLESNGACSEQRFAAEKLLFPTQGTRIANDWFRQLEPLNAMTIALALQSKNQIDSQDERGYTALIWASIHGQDDAVCYLLEAHAKIDTKDNFGQSALYYAAVNNRLPTIHLLLEAGADKSQLDMATALMTAVKNKS